MSEPRNRKILVVEDERELGRLVEIHLRDQGWDVRLVEDGLDALRVAESESFDLVVLDLMLPGIDGLEICRRLRARETYVPILMLTAKSTELDRVLGLEVGADDYMTKPFSVRELVARVKAIFRRGDALAIREVEPMIEVRDLRIDIAKREVSLAGARIHLTAKEFDLLVQFARHPGRVYQRGELLDLVWGYGEGGYEHTVNSHINRLRSKIEPDPAKPSYVLTVWGVGYKFIDPQADAA